MSRTVWNAPSATKKEVSFKPETELGYVTSNCMGRAVYQFEKRSKFYTRNRIRICYIKLYGTRRPPVRERSLS